MKRACVNFRNGFCPYTGGRCRDNMPDPCPLWRSLAKATAARRGRQQAYNSKAAEPLSPEEELADTIARQKEEP